VVAAGSVVDYITLTTAVLAAVIVGSCPSICATKNTFHTRCGVVVGAIIHVAAVFAQTLKVGKAWDARARPRRSALSFRAVVAGGTGGKASALSLFVTRPSSR
jgi:hypothetical protein